MFQWGIHHKIPREMSAFLTYYHTLNIVPEDCEERVSGFGKRS
jgi:hypothetical protein